MPEQVVIGLKRQRALVELNRVETLGLARIAAKAVLGPFQREKVTALFAIF